ncbi:MAG: FAD-dependent oxidoreductase, partial [Gemmatimonadetes bacterium]|nr:FAD-binding oxidoreductase [Gemmatimonadota bacterium]NIR81432.1 FAD-binding oxidoreductase [Gemmatimonadota bacterium]NIT90271.1 FAD-binding oxidoreductase [Gemmatimonadota bacterium]NIU34095.1 FAD-binding oxidoreductase [Gemmatimonadota bacterium]NIU38252.1 FAD-dependent oxidoreductase [Gemmatimonadota bacterium]
LRRREPHLSPDLVGGVYYPEAAFLEPARFLRGLAETARSRGVEIREGVRVLRVEVGAGRVRGLQCMTAEGPNRGILVSADAAVLATGPFSRELAGQVGVELPVQPGKGYHRDIEIGPDGAPRLRRACVLHESSVFCTPMDSLVRLAGTMEFSGLNHVMRPARLRQLTRAARKAIPDLGPAPPVSEWVGLRPMSVDGIPIVGPLGDVTGLSVATGHGMLGLTLAPVTGEMTANLVLAGGDPRLEHLSPSRFG